MWNYLEAKFGQKAKGLTILTVYLSKAMVRKEVQHFILPYPIMQCPEKNRK
jgi:hypothetical protein